MGCRLANRGAALPIVLAVLLAVSLMLAGLLQLPFAASRYALRSAHFTSEAYLAESALVAHLAGFPQGYFADLPLVREAPLGPWMEMRAGKFVALAGRTREAGRWPAYADWVDGADAYLRMFLARVQAGARRLSGNRRLFEVEPRERIYVENGDLTLNADGSAQSLSFFVEGSAVVKGRLLVDTLRIYSNGPVSIDGSVRVKFVEVYSGADVQVGGEANLRGFVWGRLGVRLFGRARALFPSVVLAMGGSLSNVSLAGKSVVEGVLAAPNGRLELEPSASWDSTDALLPYFLRGDYAAFEERLLER